MDESGAREVEIQSVTPVRLQSNHEVVQKTQNIGVILATVSEDWEQRLNALNLIAQMAVGGCARFPAYLGMLNDIKQNILVQVSDPRSAILRAAFEMLQVVSKCCGPDFQPIASYLIPDLIKMSASAKSATAKMSDIAIRVMIYHTKPMKLVCKLMQLAKANKNSIIRTNIGRYVCLMIEIASPGEIDRFNDEAADGLAALLTDKSGESRKYGKNCYALLKDYHPASANLVRNKLDVRTQETLSSTVSESMMSTLNTSTNDMSMSTTQVNTMPSRGPASTPKHAPPPSRKSIARPPARVLEDSTATTYDSQPSYSSAGDDDGRRAVTAPGRRRSNVTHEPEHSNNASIRKLPERAAQPQHNNEQWDEEEKPYINNAPTSKTLPPRGIRSTPARPPSGSAHSAGSIGTPARVPTGQPTARPASVQSAQRPPVAPRPQSAQSDDSDVDDKGYGVEELMFVLDKADSKDWTERLESFRALGLWFSVSADGELTADLSGVNRSDDVASIIRKRMNDIPQHIERICELFSNRLLDPHTRVVLEVMRALVSLVEGYCAPYVLVHLEKILVKLYGKLVDGKAQVRQAGSDVIQSIVNAFDSDSLVPVLLKVMLKIKPFVLRTIVALFPHCDVWVSRASTVKTGLQRFVVLGQEKIPDVRKAAINCVIALNDGSGDAFIGAVTSLTPSMQQTLKAMVIDEIPDLGHRITAYTSRSNEQETFDRPVVQQPLTQPVPSTAPTRKSNEKSAVGQAPVQPSAPTRPAYEYARPQTEPAPPKPVEIKPKAPEPKPVAPSQPQPLSAPVRQVQTVQAPVVKKMSIDDEWKALAQAIPSQVAAGGDSKEMALKKLIQMSIDNPRIVWKQYFGQMLLLVLECARDPISTVRTLAIRIAKEMLMRQHSYFNDYVNVVMIRLLDAIRDNEREVVLAAEEALDTLVSNLEPLKCMEVITPLVLTEQSPVLQAVIRLLARLSTRLSPDVLLEQMSGIQPGLYDAFRHPNADVRKAVVFCLVDMYGVLGDAFTPYLAKLSTSQLKLVTIYINRMKSQAPGVIQTQPLEERVGTPVSSSSSVGPATIVPGKFGTPVKRASSSHA